MEFFIVNVVGRKSVALLKKISAARSFDRFLTVILKNIFGLLFGLHVNMLTARSCFSRYAIVKKDTVSSKLFLFNIGREKYFDPENHL